MRIVVGVAISPERHAVEVNLNKTHRENHPQANLVRLPPVGERDLWVMAKFLPHEVRDSKQK